MAKQTINVGTAANDGTGDPLRNALVKANENFDELYIVAGKVALAETTANRPTVTQADDGLPFFDTTLGKPIWALSTSATGWVDATGTDA